MARPGARSQMNADGLITAELVAELAKTATPGAAGSSRRCAAWSRGMRRRKRFADFVRCRDLDVSLAWL
ncbi:hypothetical protein [Mycobacterium tuberculosis]|uniref:hypothetical protein n=1 Tax=Mycobacterium tuberculosis TaxID=1773 RepID=UPI0032B5C4DA